MVFTTATMEGHALTTPATARPSPLEPTVNTLAVSTLCTVAQVDLCSLSGMVQGKVNTNQKLATTFAF